MSENQPIQSVGETIAKPDNHQEEEKVRVTEISSEPLPNTKVIYSVPVYSKELNRGFFFRNMMGLMSQRIDKGMSFEINYLVNSGDKKPDGLTPDAIEARKGAERICEIVKKINNVQTLGRSSKVEEAQKLITEESNPQTRVLLETALTNCNYVTISALDLSKSDLSTEESFLGHYRAAGMEYAQNRFKDSLDDLVFCLYDCDTVPSTKNEAQESIGMFSNNPDLPFFFASSSYLPPGGNKSLIKSHLNYGGDWMRSYNMGSDVGSVQSPQIMLRGTMLEAAKRNAKESRKDEDFAVATGLIRQSGALYSADLSTIVESFGVVLNLNSDRVGGGFDGFGRGEAGEVKLADAVDDFLFKLNIKIRNLNAKVNTLPDDDKTKFSAAYEECKKLIEHKLKVNMRFTRLVMRTFLEELPKIPKDPKQELSDDYVRDLLQKPGGKALLNFIKISRPLIAELKSQDINYIGYLLGQNAKPANVESSSNFAFLEVIREYAGNPAAEEVDQRPKTLNELSAFLAMTYAFKVYRASLPESDTRSRTLKMS